MSGATVTGSFFHRKPGAPSRLTRPQPSRPDVAARSRRRGNVPGTFSTRASRAAQPGGRSSRERDRLRPTVPGTLSTAGPDGRGSFGHDSGGHVPVSDTGHESVTGRRRRSAGADCGDAGERDENAELLCPARPLAVHGVGEQDGRDRVDAAEDGDDREQPAVRGEREQAVRRQVGEPATTATWASVTPPEPERHARGRDRRGEQQSERDDARAEQRRELSAPRLAATRPRKQAYTPIATAEPTATTIARLRASTSARRSSSEAATMPTSASPAPPSASADGRSPRASASENGTSALHATPRATTPIVPSRAPSKEEREPGGAAPPIPARSPNRTQVPSTRPRPRRARPPSTANPAPCETADTASTGARRLSVPPPKSAQPQRSPEPSASTIAVTLARYARGPRPRRAARPRLPDREAADDARPVPALAERAPPRLQPGDEPRPGRRPTTSTRSARR